MSVADDITEFLICFQGEVCSTEAPYGDCKMFSSAENKLKNAFVDEIETIGYSTFVN